MLLIFLFVTIKGLHPAVPYSFGEVFFVVTIISVILGCMVKYLMDYYVIKKDN